MPGVALPHSVPHDEWEVHTRSIHNLVEDVLRRVKRLEEHAPAAGSSRHMPASARNGHEKSWPHSTELSGQLVELHRKCREDLATQSSMQAHATRLDMHLETARRRTDHGLEEVRSFAHAFTDQLREEHLQQIQELRFELERAKTSISQLGDALDCQAEFNAATYTTKVQHQQTACDLRREHEATRMALTASLDALEEKKSTRVELASARAALSEAHEALDRRHEATSDLLQRTRQELSAHEKRSDGTFATLEQRSDMLQTIDSMQKALEAASRDRTVLHGDVSTERERLDETVEQQSSQGKLLSTLARRQNDMDVMVHNNSNDLVARIAVNEQAIKDIDRREKGSWEQFHRERR